MQRSGDGSDEKGPRRRVGRKGKVIGRDTGVELEVIGG